MHVMKARLSPNIKQIVALKVNANVAFLNYM
jgi:hypothetical protein